MTPSITHPHSGTFELVIAGQPRGHLSYSLPDDRTMDVEHVEVDPALRGQRLGERLVAAAVEWARANGRRLVPLCPYARAVIRKTPAFQDVLQAPPS